MVNDGGFTYFATGGNAPLTQQICISNRQFHLMPRQYHVDPGNNQFIHEVPMARMEKMKMTGREIRRSCKIIRWTGDITLFLLSDAAVIVARYAAP